MNGNDALFDSSTGAYSGTAWDRLTEVEISRARRYGDPLTLALVQVHGESTGAIDDAVNAVGTRLMERCRKEDIVGRIRDDVFGVLAVTLTGDSMSLVKALEHTCQDLKVTVVAVPHRLTRPFRATMHDAEVALRVSGNAHHRATA